MFPLDPSAWEDTDGDGYPNDLYPPSTSVPPLEEDTDDDNDGWTDIDEVNCGSDPVNATDMPVDLNGDGVCDVLDLDWDDDGIPNANETDTGVYNDSSDMGTDPWNPDTDGDGFCDGPFAVFNETDTVCIAGPDPFPLDPTMPFDTDGDGLPNDLPDDYVGNLEEDLDDDNDGYADISEVNCQSDPLNASSLPTNDLDGDGICDAQDDDVDGDGLSNATEQDTTSTSQFNNADTDGDGICDGPSAPALPAGICVAGPDAFPDDPAAWLDTDGDGDPDELVDGITTDLVLDTDDDNDGWSDEGELACGTNSKNVMSTPFDGDDDGICDVLDTQTLGYSINNVEAEMFEAYVNQSDFILMPNLTGMEPGIWTIEPALPAGLSFSGTARSGETGIISGVPTEASPMTNYTVTADNGRVNKSFTFGLGVLNDTDGDQLPDEPSLTGLETDLDDDNDGHLDEIELRCGSDPVDQASIPDVDEEGNCIEGKYAEDDSDDGNGFLMCLLPLCFIFLLALLLLGLLFKDKVILMGPEPENTTSDPAFLSGAGTKDDPFVLKPIKALKAGSTVEAKETISIVNMSPEILVNLLDLAESANDKRFRMYEVDGTTEEPGFNLEADDEGRLRLRFVFDDSDEPTYPGDTYEGLLKLGKASVYLSWMVEVKEDKRMMNKIRKEQEAAEKAEKEAKEAEEKAKAEAEAKEAEEKAKAEAEAKAAEEKAAKEAEKKAKADEKAAVAALAKKEKEEAATKKKEEAAAKKVAVAEKKAAKEAEEPEAKAKAEAEAKAAEEKAAKEAEKKAKADEKAAAAAAKKAKEEEEAKKKAEAEAKAAEEKAKAEAAAKKKAEKKPAATKEAKKQEELQRVKKRAKSIDFKVIGEATSTELKSEVKKGAKTLEVGNASEFADSGSAAITDSKGSTLISWTGKDGNVLTGVTGVTRVFGVASVVMVKDDLQVIKGIGPFLEEKLNALGITTYRQLANMNAKLEEQVNEAIEFFPGRVKRDQWVAQAKILLGEDVKLDEKALKQAEELERIAQKAEGIDFGILGVASASEADDLQKIKGIGPFIAEKLNALGIYKFSQLANMTSEIEEEVNVAIEFFPGRVKRDEWARQAKEFDSN
jgi:predicted flap endonuclease-1-like 5' DNA nuclease